MAVNEIRLIGNMVDNAEVRYTASQMATAKFKVAVSRGHDKDGNDKGADFIPCKAFGKTAEVIERWCHKGDKVYLSGRLHEDSYKASDGKTIYYHEVVINALEFMQAPPKRDTRPIPQLDEPDNFEQIQEDIPF